MNSHSLFNRYLVYRVPESLLRRVPSGYAGFSSVSGKLRAQKPPGQDLAQNEALLVEDEIALAKVVCRNGTFYAFVESQLRGGREGLNALD
jgi:hypothetical protein